MGDISIIARRLADGHVQYGWSGNGGYFCFAGSRLLEWYQNSEDVEYLFGLGQTACIGRVGSEKGGYSFMETHAPNGRPFWLGNTERDIFSRIAWIDYGYFYDLDHKWYDIIPGPFRIKLPLELMKNKFAEYGYNESDFQRIIGDKVLKYIFNEYRYSHSDFNDFLENEGYDLEKVIKEIEYEGTLSMYELYRKFYKIFAYFDDWVLIKADDDCKNITEIIVRKKEDTHLETCNW